METEPLQAIQAMHHARVVGREGLIGWYYHYRSSLPRLRPERSDTDLLLALATWMELSEAGGRPGFPAAYRTTLDFSSVDLDGVDRPSFTWLLALGIIVAGLITAFSEPWLGGALVVGGVGLQWLIYRSRGGRSAVALKKPEIRARVDEALKWVEDQRITV